MRHARCWTDPFRPIQCLCKAYARAFTNPDTLRKHGNTFQLALARRCRGFELGDFQYFSLCVPTACVRPQDLRLLRCEK